MANIEYLLNITCDKAELKSVERRIHQALVGVEHTLCLDMAGSNDNPCDAEYAALPE